MQGRSQVSGGRQQNRAWPETLRAGGEMGARILAHDWARTPLGPIERWGPTLRSTTSLVLEASFPTVLYWGDELIAIYNDAYRPLLGAKPEALGRSLHDIWPEVRDTVEPIANRALAGEASFRHNMRFTLLRNGRPEEAWFDWGFSPVRDDKGAIVGVLNTTVEQTARSRSEQALRESEQRNRSIVESISDGLVTLDRDWRITYLNPRGKELVRPMYAAASDLVGRDFWETFPGQEDTVLAENYRRAMRDQETVAFEAYYPPLDGWFDIRAYPSQEGLAIYFLDVTERKQAEEALRRSERLLQAILDQMPSGVSVAEAPSGRLLYHNEAAVAVLGHPMLAVTEANGYARYGALHDDGSPYAAEEYPIARALTGEVVEQEEMRYRRGDLTLTTLSVNAAPVRDESGEIKLAVSTFHDIDELKRVQEELRLLNETLEQQVEARTEQAREKEERFRRLVEASASTVWTADADGRVVEDSPSWRAYTGQTPEQWHGDGWLDAVHPADRALARDNWNRAVADGTSQDVEFRLWHAATQSYRWISTRSVPLRDASGEVHGWIGMDLDIDERKRAQERVRELAARLTIVEQEERRRIAQILHDDLQQMLHGIDMKLDGIAQELAATDRPDLIDELKDARWWVAKGVTTTRSLTVDLSPPILRQEKFADALGWLRRHMRELHGLDVEMEAEHPFPLTDRDLRVLLFQVVRELLFNVKKHSGVNRARLELEEAEGRLVIHVIDEGSGFDVAEALQCDGRTSAFGLFGIQERLGLLGGRLEVASKPGEGTHVRVYSPPEPGRKGADHEDAGS